MEYNSPLCMRHVMLSIILLLFALTSNAQPIIDYNDVVNLLPTEPQTINDTLAAIVQDPVVQDAVEDSIGNGSLEGLVVKKKVFIIPATEPTKVVSEREQILMVPMADLEDVKKNITESVNEEIDKNSLTMLDAQSFTQDGTKGFHGDENNSPDMSQQVDFHERTLEEFSTHKSYLPIDDTPREIPYLAQNPGQEIERPEDYQPHHLPPTAPIIAFLDPAKISDDKIDVPIAATLSEQDGTSGSRLELLENDRDEIRQNVQNYIDGSSLTVDPDYWGLSSSPSQTSLLYEPATMDQYARDFRSETSLPVAMPYFDIVTPLVWTSDMDIDYSKDPHDMDTAADIVFRPLFRFRQEKQRRSWRGGIDNNYGRSPYRRYNSYNSYPRRNYRSRPRYSGDYY